jgi:uncharacterized protein YbjT (DUF2867 family)
MRKYEQISNYFSTDRRWRSQFGRELTTGERFSILQFMSISTSSRERHLITGATGNIGGRVVERLLARGERPRILCRDPARARARFGERVAMVSGDLTDGPSLTAALDGIDALFLVTTGSEIGSLDAAAADRARAAGVRKLVKLSSLDAQRDGGSAIGGWHVQGEKAIRASGLAFTFVQPAGFQSNALAWAASIRADGTVRASTGDGRIAMIHPDDIADVAVAALTRDEWLGQALPITGPEALSYGEMIAILAEAIGRPIAFQPITDEQARLRLLGNRMPAPVADALVSLWRAVREGQVATVTDTVSRVLGRPPCEFRRWAEENVASF